MQVVQERPKLDFTARVEKGKLVSEHITSEQQIQFKGDDKPCGVQLQVATDSVEMEDVPRYLEGIQRIMEGHQLEMVKMKETIQTFVNAGIPELGPRMDGFIKTSSALAPSKKAHEKFMRKFGKEFGGAIKNWIGYQSMVFQLSEKEKELANITKHMRVLKEAVDGKTTQ